MSDATAEISEETVAGSAATEGENPEKGPERTSAETRNSSQMFEFSRFVHVGPGAEECDDAETGDCKNPMHFHAWIRLPNQLQIEGLREKGDAAAARKLRLLRDEDSDSRAILDGELEEMARTTDKGVFIDSIVNADFLKDHMAAMNAVRTDEELGFATIEDDRERLRALTDLPDEERPQEEYEELHKHVAAYTDAVNAEREAMQQPLRDSLQDKPIEELVDLVRENRIQLIAKEANDNAYQLFQWYVCTLRCRRPDKAAAFPSERIFPSVDHLKAAPPEVIAGLRQAFLDIEARAGRSLQGASSG
jgi:hypothetical protein